MSPKQRARWKTGDRPVNQKVGEGFTLIELLVVVAVIAVLIAILVPCLNRAREAGRRAKCMGNLRQLQIAWHTYAENHGGSIVCGMPTRWGEMSPVLDPQAWLKVGKPWLFDGDFRDLCKARTRAHMDAMMRTGALGSYVADMDTYRCPGQPKVPNVLSGGDAWLPAYQWLSSYGIVSSMNGFSPAWRADTEMRFNQCRGPSRIPVYVTKLSQVSPAGPAGRMVFLDVGYGSGWAHNSNCAEWDIMRAPEDLRLGWPRSGCGPPIHHSMGTCVSFADGHVRHWTWKDPNTIAWSQAWRDWWDSGGQGPHPQSPPFPEDRDNQDYSEFHEAIWGRR